MGIFGRSRSDEILIRSLTDERNELQTKVQRQNTLIVQKNDRIVELEGFLDAVIERAHFRDKRGVIGAKGKLPEDLSCQLNLGA